jgi:hypothetical protein
MSGLRESLAEHLAVRRALGYRLERTEQLLGQFLDYLDAAGADRITVAHAVAWATLPGRGEHWHAMRLGADLALNERALARTKPLDSKPGRYRPPDALLRFLDGL